MIVVTAIIQNKFYFAESLDEAEVLIDDALSGRFWNSLTKLYASDRPCSDGTYPGHQLGLGTEKTGAHAAVHFVTTDKNGLLLQSLNPTPLADAPEIIFDSEGGIFFPPNAIIPRAAAKTAALEYCRTSELPSALSWQPSYWS
ncbi:Imm1 family immunity protein [Allokutzneria sp. A3M-2-11 16]|uniref:Imm1 family immunity protein n=1 Tax=Allokutzneria sp. A3M-2-11 16 TaxID=2962043 RepID=UPI0020B7D924|nr:Imm1 family immunity protein [Allokutzneria sp. A3M-2-11 16]MCP3800671.1 Imm1 family immunity protein [Allokutzneria sp. A3M-2-11 16]